MQFFMALIGSVSFLPFGKRRYSIWLRSSSQFCSFMPPHPGNDVEETENAGIPMCTSSSLDGRIFHEEFIKSAHYLQSSSYVQVMGIFDRTKYNPSNKNGGVNTTIKTLVMSLAMSLMPAFFASAVTKTKRAASYIFLLMAVREWFQEITISFL
ncbi:hypothetical protein BY458DRAFT_494884 [Sporodiniella umbellata]|nr:hypothetical protein BY458DRAFT_494884 [Sporodiniella umbellata]